ncbi:MAG: hypothetical protein ACI4NM_05865 [Bullifex sp.]
MDKVILRDTGDDAIKFASALSRYSEVSIFSVRDRGVEAKSVTFILTESKGGITSEARKALSEYSCSPTVGWIGIITMARSSAGVSHIECERVLNDAGLAVSYAKRIKLPFTEDDARAVADDINSGEIKIPYRFPLSKTVGRITKWRNEK